MRCAARKRATTERVSLVVVAAREAKKRRDKKRTKKALHKNNTNFSTNWDPPILFSLSRHRIVAPRDEQNAEENAGIKARDRSTTTAKVYT